MKVLLLSPYPENILNTIKIQGDSYFIFNKKINKNFIINNQINFIISYGYKHIISKEVINYISDSIINLHISYLPFNRGYYPNLWSFLESSPSGVSIHRIDTGIDTGEILLRKKVFIDIQKNTFNSSYNFLRNNIENLFNDNWKMLRVNKIKKINYLDSGSYHSKSQGDKILKKLQNGWDTNIFEALNNLE